MLTTLVLIIHVVVCIALILIILLQTGKGADIGAAFGGGSSQTVFGSTGATTFLSKVTIGAAVVFMVTSFILTYFSGKGAVITDSSMVTRQAPLDAVPEEAIPLTGQQPQDGKSGPASSETQPAKEEKPPAAAPASPPAAAPEAGAGEKQSAPAPGPAPGGAPEGEKK